MDGGLTITKIGNINAYVNFNVLHFNFKFYIKFALKIMTKLTTNENENRPWQWISTNFGKLILIVSDIFHPHEIYR